MNRKINNRIFEYKKDPLVQYYNEKYNIGTGFCFVVLKSFGDSKYSNSLCEFISNWQKEHNASNATFKYLIEEFEGIGHGIMIENKLNLED